MANFTPSLPLSATVSIERPGRCDPLMTSAFSRPPPPFQSDMTFSKNPLHRTLIKTLNVYLIQLKTERCQVNFIYAIIIGEYINAVVSRIVIDLLDFKQFLPNIKYFCWRQQGLDPLPPCQQPSAFWKPLPLGCWRHMWTLPYDEMWGLWSLVRDWRHQKDDHLLN